MQNKVMEIVKKICKAESVSCRGLDQQALARKLMDIANIPPEADIQEIPVNWDNMVLILFLLPNDKNYYSLFAGIGIDGNFHFELSITGKLLDNGYFDFFEEHGEKEQILPIDYFCKKELKIKDEYNPEVKIMYYHIEPIAVPKLTATTEENNKAILTNFYAAVEWLLSRGYEEYHEEYSNTINPAQQNIFYPLRSYRVLRNGHYKSVKIFQKAFGGCVISECNLQNEISM